MLKVDNISTGYGEKQVLYDVSFQVSKGEIVLLTGGNGSGKSTLLKAIFQLIPLWSGNIIYQNYDLISFSTFNIFKQGIVYIPQSNNVFYSLTVEDNLRTCGSMYKSKGLHQKTKNIYENFPILWDLKKRTPFNLSGGEKQILAIGMGLMHEPKLVLIDEPYAGIDNFHKNQILNFIYKQNESHKTTFVIVVHENTIKYSNRYLIESGKIKKS